MSEFLTTDVAPQGSSAPAEGNVFSGSQWGGPDSWDGPVWSAKYHKYITQKDADFEEAEEAVAAANKKKHEGEHSDALHQNSCLCSIPSHHTSYLLDIKRRIEPMVESISKLESQVGELSSHVKKNTNTNEDHDQHQQQKKSLDETLTNLKGHVHDIAQKMHAIILNAEGKGTGTGKGAGVGGK